MSPPLPYTDTEICTTAIAAPRNWLLWLSFHVENRHNKPGQKKEDQLGSYFNVNHELALAIGVLSSTSETEQDHMVLANLTAPTTMSSACPLPLENFNQRISLIREVRNAETKENNQRNLNNNNVVRKHSQGPLVLSQGL